MLKSNNIIVILVLFLANINLFAQSEIETIKSFKTISFNEIIEKHKGKVILVDYWASWCAPCRKDLKKTKKIKENFSSNEVAIVYISMDTNKEMMNKAIQKDGIIEVENNYMSSEVKSDFKSKELGKFNALPRYVLYNTNGDLIDSDLKLKVEEVVEKIKSLL